jgi:hypothetical protein
MGINCTYISTLCVGVFPMKTGVNFIDRTTDAWSTGSTNQTQFSGLYLCFGRKNKGY